MTSLTLALDAMGGDHGPHVTVPAALRALKSHYSLKIILVGDKTEIDVYLHQAEQELLSRIQVIHTDEVVSMSDRPVHVNGDGQGAVKNLARRGQTCIGQLFTLRDAKASLFIGLRCQYFLRFRNTFPICRDGLCAV